MDGPSRPPDYSLPMYGDDQDTPTGHNPAAVRLLTSVDEPYHEPPPERPRPQGGRSYQPSTLTSNMSGVSSYISSINPSSLGSGSIIDDAPSMPHPDSTYIPFASRAREGSPTRPWTPSSRSSEYTRPPATNLSYEPSDLNGSPRPGTPSSRYGGSPVVLCLRLPFSQPTETTAMGVT
uniref:Uncharacterized protein n=1 Tax=Bionectria ochroleuca TaxID=29856 RepID=A0A8H7N6Q9_BIOOC